MYKLSEWQQQFIKNAIGNALIAKNTKEYAELEKFEEEFYKFYPDSGVDE